MPILLAEVLNFQGSTHLIGVGSLSKKLIAFCVGASPIENPEIELTLPWLDGFIVPVVLTMKKCR